MNYYILLPADTEPCLLGEESLGTFYSDHGFDALANIIYQGSEEVLDSVRIINEQGLEIALSDFFDILNKLKMVTPN